ncbi:NAD-dependent 4,6-dehydratase LegB [Legionella hackeliae]|uniref:NAD-dependent epimerase/dehydratase n=1 Tax=Legionella hackeliae TaxID=449 RepID=A0A0A8UT11_LEGHA|nr:NAD-dependent 4,6-dehydratase LegB [Legionella hackeliae]KTD08789.1 dTDP-D-glucose 4,6-dehydratase [Legionella hackeliae]CEK10217.1 NAD-dependent epimerase/dehydratase [Legionella hackeliae]STX46946.1 dTDP-D-glucose 4,6-dehydratase [Legionella hackeliae]
MHQVLVTGADGFIGSHLVEFLVNKGFNVKALAQYNSFNNWGWLEDVDCINEIEVVTGDIRDPQYCKNITKGIDTIFHLAALIAIPYSYVAPHSYIDTNVAGTLNICQAALENEVAHIIHTSTSEVYGTAMYVPIDEKHPLQPQSPYSASKIGADAIAMSFYNSFNLPLTIARPFNTYGPRQSARAVIPTIITQIAGGKTQIQLGDLSPTRDFNYVEDTCHGFLTIAQHREKTVGEVINIGSNYEISIGDTLALIRELMGSQIESTLDEQRIRPEKSEVARLWCDNTKIFNLTGFKPNHSIQDGLRKTIEWFTSEKNLSKYKVNLYNV